MYVDNAKDYLDKNPELEPIFDKIRANKEITIDEAIQLNEGLKNLPGNIFMPYYINIREFEFNGNSDFLPDGKPYRVCSYFVCPDKSLEYKKVLCSFYSLNEAKRQFNKNVFYSFYLLILKSEENENMKKNDYNEGNGRVVFPEQ